MSSINKNQKIYTHEGIVAKKINLEQQLRRSVMACFLWEDNFYEDGVNISERIESICDRLQNDKIAAIAIEARNKFHLRHVPLLLAKILTQKKYFIKNLLPLIINRPDEITEFLAIYWKDGRVPLSAQVKKGLAKCFLKFNEYQFAKYDRDTPIKLRDALFMCHAKPETKEQEELFKKIIERNLAIPDTWEVSLSAGKDKKETWERLLKENKLGSLAFLRNLRNMVDVNADEKLIKEKLMGMKFDKVLPFRFITTANNAPGFETELEIAMLTSINKTEKLKGKTVLFVDVSGSMEDSISYKSKLSRIDAACGLAIYLRAISDDIKIFTFSEDIVEVPPRSGFALKDVIINSQCHNGTFLGYAIRFLIDKDNNFDRLIVITDEQVHDSVPDPKGRGYMINISTNKNGVGYGKWLHIDGWSESVINYIQEYEKEFSK